MATTIAPPTAREAIRSNPRRLARFEIALSMACMLVPGLLIAFDDGPDAVRDSISSYWDMGDSVVFYYGLTVAALLFLVRGARRGRLWYNFWLGAALTGVIWFNEEFWMPWHGIFAAVFFGGGVLAIVVYSEGDWAGRIKPWLLGLAVVVILLWKPAGVITLFWAEWLAMLALAAHFIVHAYEEIRAEAAADAAAARAAEEPSPLEPSPMEPGEGAEVEPFKPRYSAP